VQFEQRTRRIPIVEPLTIEAGEGLCRLPAPSPGDLFLDLEGARFAREDGREFLFGVGGGGRSAEAGENFQYQAWWALDDEEEKRAFEAVVDLIIARWAGDPGMHVYHFNHYEPTAFKKLMGRHVTRGDAMDRLLRAERFVDLYPIVRQAVRAGVESYSIKQLEQYFGFARRVELRTVREPLVAVELALESDSADAIAPEIRATAGRRRRCGTGSNRSAIAGSRAASTCRGRRTRRRPSRRRASPRCSRTSTRCAPGCSTGCPRRPVRPNIRTIAGGCSPG
jgi:uncharacterized protein